MEYTGQSLYIIIYKAEYTSKAITYIIYISATSNIQSSMYIHDQNTLPKDPKENLFACCPTPPPPPRRQWRSTSWTLLALLSLTFASTSVVNPRVTH